MQRCRSVPFACAPPSRLGLSLVVVLTLFGTVLIAAPEAGREDLPTNLEPAIERGLLFLRKQQRPNGAFEGAGSAASSTGLSLMAFLSAGHIPDIGRHGGVVRNGVNFLLSIDPEGGFLGKDAKGNESMHAHCIATVALAQAHGLETLDYQRRRVRTALEKSLSVLYAAQDVRKGPAAEGGWRSTRNASDSDLTSSAWGVLALVSCLDAGLEVPRSRLDRARDFVLRCYRPRERGFANTPGEVASTPLTGAGLLCLALLKTNAAGEIAPAAEYVADKPIQSNQRQYYESQVLTTLGAYQSGGKAWAVSWKSASESLLPAQRKEDGSWPPKAGDAPAEGDRARLQPTALSIITLSTPLRLLPLYHR